jgi:hypothetical protein
MMTRNQQQIHGKSGLWVLSSGERVEMTTGSKKISSLLRISKKIGKQISKTEINT